MLLPKLLSASIGGATTALLAVAIPDTTTVVAIVGLFISLAGGLLAGGAAYATLSAKAASAHRRIDEMRADQQRRDSSVDDCLDELKNRTGEMLGTLRVLEERSRP